MAELARLPRLFQHCSNTQEGLTHVLESMEANPTDLAAHCLLHPQSQSPIATHPFRGFTILNNHDSQSMIECKQLSEKNRPVWYIFSGMGTQWSGMGQELMKLDAFRISIFRSNECLTKYGINLIDIIYGGPSVYQRTLNAFVGIASIQIALVDCLRRVGVEPAGIVGHSVGELGCAYADGCFSAEETLLAAYYRGKCIEEANLPAGAMAAVGLSWEECQRRLVWFNTLFLKL
jgi:fatty acid synthase